MIPNESSSASIPSLAAGSQPVEKAHGGKVVHDSRGNAVWDWAVATGVLAGKKAAELLRMLDDPTLAIEGECELAGEWAGDPYNRR
jgi:ornithine cyclodeaminase/alanine dehydrogenase-like protein (mu-crystallin family)